MANKKPVAKKVTKEVEVVEQVFVPTEVIEEKVIPVKEELEPAKPEWEIKDRIYYLSGSHTPLTLTIPGKHTRKHALLYFDPITGKQKELRYATNHDSPFKEDQKGEATMGHIQFKNGDLKDLVYHIFEIDAYASKMGDDKNIVTLSFTVKHKEPGDDLVRFLEGGYSFILDADITAGEQSDGNYRVFVELERNRYR